MSDLLRFESEGGGAVLVEVAAAGGGPVTRGGRPGPGLIEDAGESLERVLGQLGPVVNGVVSQLRQAADWPDEVEVEFAVKISADSNVIIARAGGEANFRVALKWARKADR